MITVTREVLDVSEMPHGALDHRSPIWWGNLCLLIIETTMFGILAAAYFYIRQNFTEWPPVQSNFFPPNFHPVPDLGFAITNLLVIVASCAPMIWADRSALKMKRRGVDLGLVGCILLGLAAIAFRSFEFHALKFRWDDNAYASVVWMILGMHVTHLIVGTCENGIMLAWVLTHGLDDKHARDVRVSALYWYWIAAIWLPLWAIVFLGPRIL
jgi:heme/copper-type cytochrome/quinol oxidase subunit 3